MTKSVTETFFLPDEIGRLETAIPAEIYNLAHTLLVRSEYGCVFVPIRSLQFMAVITDNEIVFVDSQAYAYNQEEGGRVIMLAWQFKHTHERTALTAPVECEVVFYHADGREIQLRLVAEFKAAVQLLDERYRDQALPPDGAKILKL